MKDQIHTDAERITKSAVGPAEGLYDLREEVTLIATDSTPKLDQSTVRIESIDNVGGGWHRITISGEKSEFCPTNE